jgi:hypothetical protein
MSPQFDRDDYRLAVVLDCRGSNHASIAAYGDIVEFAHLLVRQAGRGEHRDLALLKGE